LRGVEHNRPTPRRALHVRVTENQPGRATHPPATDAQASNVPTCAATTFDVSGVYPPASTHATGRHVPLRKPEHRRVPRPQVVQRQVQRRVRVFAVRVRPGLINQHVRPAVTHKPRQLVVQHRQQVVQPRAVGQRHRAVVGAVGVPHRLDVAVRAVRVVVVAVDREVQEVRPRRAQRRGAVAVVQVQVEHGHALRPSRVAQQVRGEREPVEGAEALAVVGVGVVEARAQRGGLAVVERRRGGLRDGPVGEQHAGPQRRRPGELLRLGQRPRLPRTDGVDVVGRVHQPQVIHGHRPDGPPVDRQVGPLPQRLGDHAELPHRHGVGIPDGRGEGGVVEHRQRRRHGVIMPHGGPACGRRREAQRLARMNDLLAWSRSPADETAGKQTRPHRYASLSAPSRSSIHLYGSYSCAVR
jgi:hypothetical protein